METFCSGDIFDKGVFKGCAGWSGLVPSWVGGILLVSGYGEGIYCSQLEEERDGGRDHFRRVLCRKKEVH